MVLAKSDLEIAERYVRLAPPAARPVFDRIKSEFERTVGWLLELRGAEQVLADEPTLRRSIRLRNPYVDPMNLLQVDLLDRWRATDRTDDALFEALLASVQGIARGLKKHGGSGQCRTPMPTKSPPLPAGPHGQVQSPLLLTTDDRM